MSEPILVALIAALATGAVSEPILVALIAALATGAVAVIGIFTRVRNNKRSNKKNNPGSLHDVLVLLTKMDGKLSRLENIENKLDDLVGRQ